MFKPLPPTTTSLPRGGCKLNKNLTFHWEYVSVGRCGRVLCFFNVDKAFYSPSTGLADLSKFDHYPGAHALHATGLATITIVRERMRERTVIRNPLIIGANHGEADEAARLGPACDPMTHAISVRRAARARVESI